MRNLLTIVAAIAALAATASMGSAQTDMSQIPWYPWCALSWSKNSTEHRSCGYVSYEQCRFATRAGSEMCFENIWGPKPVQAYRSDEKRLRQR
jgi:hypothetical protein